MRTLLLVILGAWLAGATGAMGQDLPEGIFASSQDGCAALKTKTVVELGEDLDFYVLTKSGVSTYMQRCDFTSVTPHGEARWLATAFCDEDGYVYPDLFAIAQKEDGGLAVSRLTDVTQQQGTESEIPESFTDDMNPVELGREPSEGASEEPAATEPVSKPDAFNHYILCPDVKP